MRRGLGSLARARMGLGLVVRSGVCGFSALAVMFAVAAIAAKPADAKPTGWQSASELKGSDAATWSGYGEAGYMGRPAKSKARAMKAAKSKVAKSKALKAYASSFNVPGSKAKAKGSKKRYAAIDTKTMTDVSPSKSLTGGGVRWAASSSCLNGTLRSVVAQVAANYGSVTVNSTCRSRGHNRKVGGAPKSHHLSGNAVDFRVHGSYGAAYAFLRSHGSLGGVKHYGGGLFHVDTGPKRSW